jgi:hypothetical protein
MKIKIPQRPYRNTTRPTWRYEEQALNDTVSISGQDVLDEMTDSIAHGRVKAITRLFYQTCPGDWDRGQIVGFGGTLRAYYELDEFKERARQFAFAGRWAFLRTISLAYSSFLCLVVRYASSGTIVKE